MYMYTWYNSVLGAGGRTADKFLGSPPESCSKEESVSSTLPLFPGTVVTAFSPEHTSPLLG